MIHGVLPVYKPATVSLTELVKIVKEHSPLEQTLSAASFHDDASSGVVLILLGSMQDETTYFDTLERRYRTWIRLGCRSTTGTIDGALQTQKNPPDHHSLSALRDHVESFIGTRNQAPTRHASKDLQKDQQLITKYREIEVTALEVEHYDFPLLHMAIQCSPETDIPALSFEIFQELSIDSFMIQLEQLEVGDITIGDCAFLEDIVSDSWDAFLFTPDEDLA